MSPPIHKSYSEPGFTLLEVLVAIPILVIGLLSLALLSARMMSGTRDSTYMSLAATTSSEKIEDLNRWAFDDPQVCVPTASATAGSLTADVSQSVTCPSGGKTANVNYFDDVALQTTNGSIAETVGTPGPVYTTTTHTADGHVVMTSGATAPTSTTFHRRWIIEKDSPVAGVRRVTVIVTLLDASVRPGEIGRAHV